MNYTLEHKKAFTIIGLSTQIKPEEGFVKCPQFWEEAYSRKYVRLWATMTPENGEEQAILDNRIGMLAACIEGRNGFEYMIAGEYQGGAVPQNMKLYDFPESDWVVFKAKGPLPQSLQQLNNDVWQQWYPNEGQAFLPNGTATIEHYSMGDQSSPEYECEIWVPVIQKESIKK